MRSAKTPLPGSGVGQITAHDSRPTSHHHLICCHLDDGCGAGDAPPEVSLEVVAGVAEQGLHGLAAVVAGDVGVEVLPDAFDAVRVGAAGRQEVQDDATAELVEGAAGQVSGVDGVVVDNVLMATPIRRFLALPS